MKQHCCPASCVYGRFAAEADDAGIKRITFAPPGPTADSVTFFPDQQEYSFSVPLGAGRLSFLGVIGKESSEAIAASCVRTNLYK